MAETLLNPIEALSTLDADGLSFRPWRPAAILQLAAWSEDSAAALAAWERGVFGAAVAGAGATLTAGGLRLWPVAPWRRLLIAETDALPDLPAEVAAMSCTGGFTGLRLDGPRSRDLLAKLAAVDLHPDMLAEGDFATARVEHVRVHLQRAGADAFDLLLPVSTAEFTLGALADAALEFGARIDPALLHRPTPPQESPRAFSLK
ncbi:sarcosine oxidase subunit gamma family protein [Inquilinus sp. NPDC058860]|uniref:sarcosine oxidase subunit gamma family protein n=1 Tax=Inquilinus sp. NPDC058860 TaxID=3346652 RepID=UPI0036B27C11